MRILIFSQYWAPENGVPQRRWTWLTNILIEAGHEVLVVAPPAHYDRQVSLRSWIRLVRSERAPEIGPSGETIIRSFFIPSNASLTAKVLNQAVVSLGFLWEVFRTNSQARRFRPDLVVGTVPAIPTAMVAVAAARTMRVPSVIDLRDAWPDLLEYSESWNNSVGKPSVRELILRGWPLRILKRCTRSLMISSFKSTSAMIVTAERLRARLQREYGISEGRIATIRNVFPAVSIPPRPLTDDGHADLHVLYAGTLGRAQGLENAVQAVRILAEEGIAVELKIVGSGAARLYLSDLAESYQARISVEPRTSADKLDTYYQWADTALVHLGTWEPLEASVPSKTYELMENRIHISGVAAGETAYILESLDAGFCVPPGRPELLAREWRHLIEQRQKLHIGGRAEKWVRDEREHVAPRRLLNLLEGLIS